MTCSNYFVVLLLIFSFSKLSFGQLPTCTQTGDCPTNGVWGEWKTIGNSTCTMSCGGCGSIFQARDCISAPVCNCTGNFHRYIGCNFDTCKYPAQKTCCSPYLPMVLNGTQTCGPLPKSIDNSACCPSKELVSEWAGWEFVVVTNWTRTRTCLTESIGCPCTKTSLIQYQEVCPCTQPSDATTTCANVAVGSPIYYRQLEYENATCTAYLTMIAEVQGTKVYCKNLTDTVYKDGYGAGMEYQGAMLIMEELDGTCTTDIVFDCDKGKIESIKRQYARFTCNLDTLNWIYDYTGEEIKGIVQGVWR